MPNRPNWKNEDWLDYFKENHPNFWFQKQLKEKVIRKLNLTIPAENDADEDNGNMGCRFFKWRCKIGKIFASNQHVHRKLLSLENWCNGEVSKSALI